MSKVAVLGSGQVGQILADGFLKHGHDVVMGTRDPAKLADWWAEQFEGETQELIPGEFIAVIRSDGPRLGFQKVDDPTPGKNRVHLDFGAADVDAEVSRLTAAGATEVGRHGIGDNFRWVVLVDPAGNAFCVAGTG